MPKSRVVIGAEPQDIIAGLNTQFRPHQISNGATPFCVNVDFSRNPGAISKRRGREIFGCSRFPSEGFVNGLQQYIDENQQETIFAAYCDNSSSSISERVVHDLVDVDVISYNAIGDPIKITVTAHGLSTGDVVLFQDQSPDYYLLADNYYTITVLNANDFTLNGTVVRPVTIEQVIGITAPDPNTVTLKITAHGLSTGNLVDITNLSPDSFSISGNTYNVTVIDLDHFVLDGAVAGSTMAYVPTTGNIGNIADRTSPQAGHITYTNTVANVTSSAERIAIVPEEDGSSCVWTDVYPNSALVINEVTGANDPFEIDELFNDGVHTNVLITATGLDSLVLEGTVGYFTSQAPDSYGIKDTYHVLRTTDVTDTYDLVDKTLGGSAITFKFFPESGYVQPGISLQVQPVLIDTTTDHGLITGDKVLITGLSPDTFGVNGFEWTITRESDTLFTLDGSETFLSGSYTPDAGTVVVNTNSIPCGDINFTTFQNICIAVGANIATLYWYTGITPNAFIPLLGLPPANGQQITVFQNRVFIGDTSAGSSRLHFSAASNAFDWTSANNAGFIDINPNDGEYITGLEVCGGYLFIYKQTRVYILSGADPSTFAVAQAPTFDGAPYGRSLVNFGTFINFLSQRAVQSTAPGSYNAEQSKNIIHNIDGTNTRSLMPNISTDARLTAVGGRRLFQYWLAFDADGSGVNGSAYVLDYITQCWTYYDNVNARLFKTFINGDLMSGAGDQIAVYRHDVGETDIIFAGVTPIDTAWQWFTKEFVVTDISDIKTLNDVFIMSPVTEGATVTLNTFINGSPQGDPVIWSLSASRSMVPNSTTVVQYADMLVAEQGNTFQFSLSDDSTYPIVIDGLAAIFDITGHIKWGGGPISANPPTQ